MAGCHYRRPLDEAVRVHALRLLRRGVAKTEVMARLEIGEGTIYRLLRSMKTRQPKVRQGKVRCNGCGGLLKTSSTSCLVCRDRKEGP